MTTVTRDKPFWAASGHDPQMVSNVHMLPNHTLCGFFAPGLVYSLNHETRLWHSLDPEEYVETWCYYPIVDWLCYPGTPEFDRIIAAHTAVVMGACPTLVTDVTSQLAKEHGYG